MREIKFRAWDEKNKLYIFFDKTDILDGYGFELIDFSIPWSDWEQFTGLHDKNGKEIYEGDIVKNISSLIHWHDDGEILEVEILPSGVKPCAEYDSDCGEYSSGEDWEIIGNIHEGIK